MYKFITSLILAAMGLTGAAVAQTQVVFLDFDTGSDSSIVYTPTMRDDVQTLMEGHYADFDLSFTQTAPGAGDFSTVFFNEGGTGGLAQQIDFRNTDQNDTAVINIDGLGLVSTADIVSASANIGSHELGHLLGLRHGDSMGAIGNGLPTTGSPGAGSYLPNYLGPASADETTDHIMASPGSVGSSIADATTPSWLSERSAIKLANNETGTLQVEGASPTPLALQTIPVPNTIVSGDNAGARDFTARLFTARGDISPAGETDAYTFSGCSGSNFNFELISSVIAYRVANTIDPQITILDSTATVVDYYGTSAFNDDEFETADSIIIDLVLPASDTYTIVVNAFAPGDTGGYELFGHTLSPNSCGPAPVCGDDMVNLPGEECDGADDGACPGMCDNATCLCPVPPVCGDDMVNQPGEECDGADDAACPGMCDNACLCPVQEVWACCTDGPILESECIEVTEAECDLAGPQGGLFLPGTLCGNAIDCVELLVTMDSMSADATPDGVLVRWTTALEIDTVAFRILREMPAAAGDRGKALVVVADRIAAMGNNFEGARYSFLDNVKESSLALQYYIEDIDIFGKVTRHGPIAIDRGEREAPTSRSEAIRQR